MLSILGLFILDDEPGPAEPPHDSACNDSGGDGNDDKKNEEREKRKEKKTETDLTKFVRSEKNIIKSYILQ